MKLYEIERELDELSEKAFDPETGEMLEEYEEQFDALNLSKDAKLEGYGVIVKNNVAELKAFETERKKLQAKEKAVKNNIAWLKGKLDFALDGEPFKTPKVSIFFKKSQQLVIPEGADPNEMYEELGDDFVKYETSYSFKLDPIKKMMDSEDRVGKLLRLNNFKLKSKRAVVIQ